MNKPSFKYPENAILVDVNDIDISERSREDFGDIEGLAKDIQKNRLIHPPTVAKNPDPNGPAYILVGGGRRMKAMELLLATHIPVNICSEAERHEIFEMELMENFNRKEMLWQEQCMNIARAHRAKTAAASADHQSWGMRETGKLLGVSVAHVSHAVMLVPYLKQKDPEILAAPSMFAAYEILLKRKEDEAVKLSAQMTATHATIAAEFMGFKSSGNDNIRSDSDDVDAMFNLAGIDTTASTSGVDNRSMDDIMKSIGAIENKVKAEKLNLDLQTLFINADCISRMPQMPSECVDHIVTDPPYGIDLEQLADIKNIDTVRDTHRVEQNISMFEPFLENAYRLLKPNGYCVFWYDLDHHEKLQSLANKMGFKCQRWPIIWQKLHACLNNSPRKNFTKNMEFAMVLRKDQACLNSPQISSIVTADGTADRKLYDNPFAKPLAVWSFILQAIAYKGQTIFDPYAGQMSCGRAVINNGMIPTGIEIDPNHYNRGIVQLTNLINEINGN